MVAPLLHLLRTFAARLVADFFFRGRRVAVFSSWCSEMLFWPHSLPLGSRSFSMSLKRLRGCFIRTLRGSRLCFFICSIRAHTRGSFGLHCLLQSHIYRLTMLRAVGQLLDYLICRYWCLQRRLPWCRLAWRLRCFQPFVRLLMLTLSFSNSLSTPLLSKAMTRWSSVHASTGKKLLL